ncbi:MAG: threonine/serine exporter family protein [Clostridia bacterium]|nr:threonine/serine exporter family protein [Clostridia bacterium]
MQKTDERYSEKVLSLALDLGKNMVKCGAEMNRVEETVIRIGYAYGMEKTEVFSIISVIYATVIDKDNRTQSQLRRIRSMSVNFEKLEKLNDLSRRICKNKPDLDEARQELESICVPGKKFNIAVCLGYMLASASFAVFFGGNLLDAAASMPIAAMIYLMQSFIKTVGASRLFFTALESAVAGLAALVFVHFGFGNNADIIMIGDIMLLIPGLMLINSLREMLCGDMMSGLLRMLESVLLAMAIAVGFALPILFWDFIV